MILNIRKSTEGSGLMNQKANYGNWVPEKLLCALWMLTILAAALLAVNFRVWKITALTVIFAVGLVVALFYAIYMSLLHHTFSFHGGGLMGRMHEYLLSCLPWDGEGKILDIGCGSGALIIRAKKKFPQSQAVGLDYWGITWDYAKEQCEKNAHIENTDSIQFVNGNAASLCYEDGYFDAVISNFVFHEVRTVSDKRSLVKEALRVVKKGGAFAFQDMFEVKRLYGDMDSFLEELNSWGVEDVHYESHTENLPFIPGSIKLMFKDMGILYGTK